MKGVDNSKRFVIDAFQLLVRERDVIRERVLIFIESSTNGTEILAVGGIVLIPEVSP